MSWCEKFALNGHLVLFNLKPSTNAAVHRANQTLSTCMGQRPGTILLAQEQDALDL